MAWLRRDKDCIALVVVWALLLQAAILSFTSGAHAAALASGGSVVLCTAKGAVIGRQLPGQNHQQADCQCCSISCRAACGGACGGFVPVSLRIPLPVLAETSVNPPRFLGLQRQSAEALASQPRAPPIA
jgi:hypothetical protein